jgi:DNA-binding XRE family transcriptional regulator
VSDKAVWIEKFGLLCHKYRVQRELSQEAVARKVDITLLSYGNIERAKFEPKARVLLRIISALGIPFDEVPIS